MLYLKALENLQFYCAFFILSYDFHCYVMVKKFVKTVFYVIFILWMVFRKFLLLDGVGFSGYVDFLTEY